VTLLKWLLIAGAALAVLAVLAGQAGLLRGRLLSDTVAILSSLNIIAGELDR